ncbi:long-chain-fatty-acid--CoA ligase [Gottfriedia acidiceleris]|uniref:long-chain-fatty-acid--CoA ligase n=1 Tax=Gottfriedia acidiceleris TaxID=371036 RepID=UPI003D25D14E
MIVTKLLIRNIKISPTQSAILEDENKLTFLEFGERVVKLKNALLEMGVKKGDRIGLLMLNDFRVMEIFYACTAIGAIHVPLNYRYSNEELEFTINDSGIKVLFLHNEYSNLVPFLRERTPTVQQFILAENHLIDSELRNYEVIIKNQNATAYELTYDDVKEDDMCALFYTAGTTGQAKGVIYTHRNLMSFFYHTNSIQHITKETRVLHTAPMFHLAGFGPAFNTIAAGGINTTLRHFSLNSLVESIKKFKLTTVLMVPTMINMIINDPNLNIDDLSSLRKIQYGGSPMPLDLLNKTMELLPNVEFQQGYGMTEGTPLTALNHEHHIVDGTEKSIRRLKSAGQVVFGVELRIVDENGNDLGPEQVGEVIFRGPNMTKGYWNLSEETAAAIKNGWFHTGDMALMDEDHFIYIIDRKKDMIITGGENVYSVEVENILYKHPDVLEAAVIGVPDDKWGEAVKAIIVRKPGSTLNDREIIQFARACLAGYKLPKSVEFREELPKTSAGKIMKRKLKEPFWNSRSGISYPVQ